MNILTIDHRLPAEGRGGRVKYLVTTAPAALPSNQFPDREVRQEIRRASTERGRALFCIDIERDEVMAALSYHFAEGRPLVIRTIALRRDEDAPQLWQQSRVALVICKAHLHVFGEKALGKSALDFDADTQVQAAEATQFLGFELAPRPRGVRASAKVLLRQRKLGR